MSKISGFSLLAFSTLFYAAIYGPTIYAQQVDPTKPFDTGLFGQGTNKVPMDTQQQLTLESIIVQANNHRHAIINGKLLKTGDKVGDFTVNNITTNAVNLRSTGENITLTLFTKVLETSK